MKIKAYAKVNLSFDVVGKRVDGYHLLETVMQSVSLCDEIELKVRDSGIELTCSDGSICGENNLAYRAAKCYFEAANKYGAFGGVSIHIDKKIPLAGGLGGGSADAAAVLVALNKMFVKLPDEKLLELAVSLGADVPFCVYGGTALAKGVGEQLEFLKDFPQSHIVIAKRGQKSSTGDMYNKLDSEVLKHPDTKKVVEGINNGDLLLFKQGAYNCFEQVCDIDNLEYAKAILNENGAVYSGLSGAGPSIIGVFQDLSSAKNAVKKLSQEDFFAIVCKPVLHGNEIIE